MKIVITGALGHIGSYVSRDIAFQFPGAEIVMIDNMMTQRFPSLFNMPTVGHYRFIDGDVTNMELEKEFSNTDVVIHLAAITDAAGSFDRAEQLEANNFTATSRVAAACNKVGAKLIALSSTSVYGTQNELVDENCTIDDLKPQSPYAATKLKEEALITTLGKSGLKAIVCRFGTIYGASQGMRFHTAVNKFCWQAVMGQPITVWRTAYDQKRPYLDLMDASNAFAFIIKNNLFDGAIYNVLTQNSTVKDIVDTIKDFVPSLEVTFVDNKIMNQLSYEVSSKKITDKGFLFHGNLKKSIAKTVSLLSQANRL
ncbi:MAG: NAD-dependent epimerase/dehydratase family protein [Sediminibacterium sp.]